MPDQTLPSRFLKEHLNHLLLRLCSLSNFIQPYELTACSMGEYVDDADVAERKVSHG